MNRLPIGQPITEFPARTFNHLVDFVAAAERNGLAIPPLPSQTSPIAAISAVVKNTTANDLPWASILGCDDPLDKPDSGADNGNQFRRPVLSGVSPDATTHATKFVILQTAASAGGGAEGLKIGFAYVKVYVNDAAHKFAKVKTGDTTQLESATSGPAEIWWKETGTGTKWALVLIGGGGAAAAALRWGTISTAGSAASVEGTPSTDGRIDLYAAYGGTANVPFNNYYPETAPAGATAPIDGDDNILPWSCTLWP